MRLFIAIRLSDEMKKALINCMHDLKKQGVEGNYVPAQNLHMTLAFIGEYDDPEKVKKVLKKVPMPEFRLSLSEKGNFGNILWAGVKGNQKLKAYVKELRAALDEEGIPYDRSSFAIQSIPCGISVSGKADQASYRKRSDGRKVRWKRDVRADEFSLDMRNFGLSGKTPCNVNYL